MGGCNRRFEARCEEPEEALSLASEPNSMFLTMLAELYRSASNTFVCRPGNLAMAGRRSSLHHHIVRQRVGGVGESRVGVDMMTEACYSPWPVVPARWGAL